MPHLHRDWAHRLAPKVRGHIFDVDGTLIDTMPMFYPVWPEAGKKVPQLPGLTPPARFALDCVGPPPPTSATGLHGLTPRISAPGLD